MKEEKKVTNDRIGEVVRGFIAACVKEGRDPLARFLELCKTHNIRTMEDIGIKFLDR